MRYIITAIVEAERLGEAITAIQPTLAAPIQVAAEPTPLPTRQKRDSKGDAPASTTRLGKLTLETLRTGYCTTQEIGEVLAGQGFAAGSASPILSKLIKENLVERTRTLLNGTQTVVYRLRPAASA